MFKAVFQSLFYYSLRQDLQSPPCCILRVVSGLFFGLFCWQTFRLLSGLVLFKLLLGEWLFFMVLVGILPVLLV
jgi:hypothetical protein